MRAYDKAKFHYQGEFPKELPVEQAFVHTGLFLGWIIDNDLYSEEFADNSQSEIAAFKRRVLSGPKVYELWDGCLTEDMLNEEGNAFADWYFDLQQGEFLRDYESVLGADVPTLYHVRDTWENYERIRRVIDQRYQQWRAERN